jgi:hypothetical protein
MSMRIYAVSQQIVIVDLDLITSAISFVCYSEEQAKGLFVDVCDVSDRLTILVPLSLHLFGSESEVFGWHFSFTCVADSNGCCTPGARRCW